MKTIEERWAAKQRDMGSIEHKKSLVSELVTLPKVPGTQDCTKFAQITEEQFDFTSGKGTADAILR